MWERQSQTPSWGSRHLCFQNTLFILITNCWLIKDPHLSETLPDFPSINQHLNQIKSIMNLSTLAVLLVWYIYKSSSFYDGMHIQSSDPSPTPGISYQPFLTCPCSMLQDLMKDGQYIWIATFGSLVNTKILGKQKELSPILGLCLTWPKDPSNLIEIFRCFLIFQIWIFFNFPRSLKK